MNEPDHPELTRIELLNGMKNLAEGVHTVHQEFLEQGFSESDALRLAAAYIHGLAGGKFS